MNSIIITKQDVRDFVESLLRVTTHPYDSELHEWSDQRTLAALVVLGVIVEQSDFKASTVETDIVPLEYKLDRNSRYGKEIEAILDEKER